MEASALTPAFGFDAQRQECMACAHCIQIPNRSKAGSGVSLLCKEGRHQGCSLARAEGGTCGPEASRWQPKGAS